MGKLFTIAVVMVGTLCLIVAAGPAKGAVQKCRCTEVAAPVGYQTCVCEGSSKEYFKSVLNANLKTARDECAQNFNNGRLINVLNQAEGDIIREFLSNQTDSAYLFWTGARYTRSNKCFIWPEAQPQNCLPEETWIKPVVHSDLYGVALVFQGKFDPIIYQTFGNTDNYRYICEFEP